MSIRTHQVRFTTVDGREVCKVMTLEAALELQHKLTRWGIEVEISTRLPGV